MKAVCILFLFGAFPLFGADVPADKTFGLDNGRFWNTLTPGLKDAYMRGLFEGWRLRGNTEEKVKGSVIVVFTASGQFTSNEVADMLTSIYSDSENIALPVGWVALASLAVERGETDRSTVLVALRKQMTDLLNGKEHRPNTDFDPTDTILACRIH
jgi:hypothetical protein